MTRRRSMFFLIATRTALAVGLPFILVYAFLQALIRGSYDTWKNACREVRIEWASAIQFWRDPTRRPF
ncbi:MAG TPA: hypothetical protein VMV33_17480 [Rhodocyclaceae bacterium]|nr:hypothetical protein [Rhodocyclaceae bacterium]